MPRILYLSNPCRQEVQFFYRTEKTAIPSGPKSIMIPSGGQVELGHQWSDDEFDYVLVQIEALGGRDASEAHGHLKKFTGLLFRVGLPVDEDEILMAHASVTRATEDRSVAQATNSVAAFDKRANMKGKGRRLARVTGIEVEELKEQGARVTGDEMHLNMEINPDSSRATL